MMSIKSLALIMFLLLSHTPAKTWAHKTLVIIGYADNNHITDLKTILSKPFYHQIGTRSQDVIVLDIFKKGYKKVSEEKYVNAQMDEIDLFNMNVKCPGESLDTVSRLVLCYEQRVKIEKVMNQLQSSLLQTYDKLIYLGHAREGYGLGIGPFVPESTFKLRFNNELEVGRLKKIVLASCDSQKLYADLEAHGIELLGTPQKMMWVQDLLPMVLKNLD